MSLLARELRSPAAVDGFLRDLWIIRPDPPGAEYVETPDLQIEMGEQYGRFYGDCDDAATLAAALLNANGVLCWFMAVRFRGDDNFSHVFLRTVERDIDPIAPLDVLPHRNYIEKMELMV